MGGVCLQIMQIPYDHEQEQFGSTDFPEINGSLFIKQACVLSGTEVDYTVICKWRFFNIAGRRQAQDYN